VPATTLLLSSSVDLAQPVQIAAIGLLKNLCTNHAGNAIDCLDSPDALAAVISLVKRTDEVRLKTEAVRILVQVIRSLWTPASGGGDDAAIEKAKTQLCTEYQVYQLLAGMIEGSAKYPVLINEGVVSLTRLASTSAENGTPH
jgi:hypothetical protein